MFVVLSNSGWIRVENIEEYIPNREKFESRYKLAGIKKAMKEMDDFIANPSVSFISTICFITFIRTILSVFLYRKTVGKRIRILIRYALK